MPASDDPFGPSPTILPDSQNTQGASPANATVLEALTIFNQSRDAKSKAMALKNIEETLADHFNAQRRIRQLENSDLRARLDQLDAEEKKKEEERALILADRLKAFMK